jgi:hypothetical protein
MKNGIKNEFEGTGSVGDSDSPLKTASGELAMTATPTADDWLTKYVEECKRNNEATIEYKAKIVSLLKAAGIARVTVRYSGCCDDGQMDDVRASGPKPKKGPAPEIALPEGRVTLRVPLLYHSEEQSLSLREAIEALCWKLLGNEHAGWENNEGGEGIFTLDVRTEHIKLKHRKFYRRDEW